MQHRDQVEPRLRPRARVFRFSPSRLAVGYVVLCVLVLVLFAIPLWYTWRLNYATSRTYVDAGDLQQLVEIFDKQGAKGLAAAIESRVVVPGDEIVFLADPSRSRIAGNLAAWPVGIPDSPGTSGGVVDLGGRSVRVVASHVELPGGYHLIMGRESARFRSLVDLFWYGIAGATGIALAMGVVVGWMMRRENAMRRQAAEALQRAHDGLEGLVAQRTAQLARANESLLRSEAILAEAQTLSLTGSFGWDVASGQLFWSDQTFDLLGLDRSTRPTLGEVLRRVHPEDVAFVKDALDRAAREHAELDFEHRLVLDGGAVKHVHVRARAAKHESGALEYVGAVTDVTALRRSQEALETAFREVERLKEEFRLVVDTIPGLVWRALPDGRVDFLNQRWCEYTGFSVEEAGGWGWQAAIHSDDLPGLLLLWQSLLASGTSGEAEARLRRADGAYRWFLFRAVPLRDDAGRVIKWYWQTTDIEGRRHAEALLEGEKRLLEMVATGRALPELLDALCRFVEETTTECHCGVLVVDASGSRVQYGAAPSLPVSFVQAIGSRPLHPDAAGPCAVALSLKKQVITADIASDPRWNASEWRARALAHGLRACWSTPILSHEGKVLGAFALYFRQPGTPTADHQALIGQFTHLAGIAVERAKTEDALRRSEASLARAQRLSRTGSFSWHVESGEMAWSDETYRIYGLEPGTKVTADMARDLMHPDDVPQFRAMLSGDETEFDFECRLRPRNGSTKHVQIVASARRDQSHRLLEWVGAIRDLTDRKASEDALNQLRAELAHVARVATLGELTASIAHEVNQPLAGIMNNASACLRLLAAEPPNLESAADTARRTLRDGKRAAEVIARLRDLFRKKKTGKEVVQINEAIREVIALTRHEVQKGSVVLRTELAGDLPPLVGDRVQLQQVVLNLILNAADAMGSVEDRPRELLIATERDGGHDLRVLVRDSGVGIDPEVGERIFDAFYTSKKDGMGMGLSIARSIVESHGGRLWAAPNDGPGATFVFTLPLVMHELAGSARAWPDRASIP